MSFFAILVLNLYSCRNFNQARLPDFIPKLLYLFSFEGKVTLSCFLILHSCFLVKYIIWNCHTKYYRNNVKGIVCILSISVPTYEISCVRFTMEFSTMQSLALRKWCHSLIIRNYIISLTPEWQEAHTINLLFNYINYGGPYNWHIYIFVFTRFWFSTLIAIIFLVFCYFSLYFNIYNWQKISQINWKNMTVHK